MDRKKVCEGRKKKRGPTNRSKYFCGTFGKGDLTGQTLLRPSLIYMYDRVPVKKILAISERNKA